MGLKRKVQFDYKKRIGIRRLFLAKRIVGTKVHIQKNTCYALKSRGPWGNVARTRPS